MDEQRWTLVSTPAGRMLHWVGDREATAGNYALPMLSGEQMRALCDQVDESNRTQPEPLPTMTGQEMYDALSADKSVEVFFHSGKDAAWCKVTRWWNYYEALSLYASAMNFVARVVPAAPSTRKVPWWEAWGEEIAGVGGASIGRVVKVERTKTGSVQLATTSGTNLGLVVDASTGALTGDGMVEVLDTETER